MNNPPVNKSDFTRNEQDTHDALMSFLEEYNKLPEQHPSELPDVVNAVHVIQGILGMRVLRRAYPGGWPTYNKKEEKAPLTEAQIKKIKSAWCKRYSGLNMEPQPPENENVKEYGDFDILGRVKEFFEILHNIIFRPKQRFGPPGPTLKEKDN